MASSSSSASSPARVNVNELHLPRPDDWHLHLRDGPALASLMASMPRTMARAIVMPNLKPPVATAADALAYRARVLAARPAGSDFEPLMTLYLTDGTTAADIDAAADAGVVAAKLYPAGATTNSHAGVRDVPALDPALARLAARGLPLLVHGEVTDPAVDIFDREAAFLAGPARGILARHPRLKVVIEHLTTAAGVAFVRAGGARVAGTITAHHLLFNRNALFDGGLRPHRYCLPVLKTEADRAALVEAATSGSPQFFLGTDSAPHDAAAKECACGAAGAFTAHAALELYAGVFDAAGALHRLRAFACESGPAFYGLPPNAARLPASSVRLRRAPWVAPATLALGAGAVVPLGAGEPVEWTAEVVDEPPPPPDDAA